MALNLGERNTSNATVLAWVAEMAKLCQPDKVFWCNGSTTEQQALIQKALENGILTQLNQEKLPGCYLHRSHPNDVARVEQCTYICSEGPDEAGPTNNWAPPREMYSKLYGLLRGAMKGRTLYVVPYLMGPPGSPLTKVGVELTDSIYVVLNMRIMTRMGAVAWEQLGDHAEFNRGVHSRLDLNPDRRFICHFPQD
ncbi:MAG: phosphoenolpyruvate carboxykinase, partial [Verrucomicrobiota bacterium]